MPALTSIGHVIFDANGEPLNAGRLRVYTANTTTLVSLYSDAALTVPLSNPVTANSEGRPASGANECVVYVAAGTYDVAELPPAASGDTPLRNWDDFSPGGESGDIERTVTGNGRFKVTGAGGSVYIQIGDPSPDNTGGTAVIEGQAGTQLDSLTLDGAIVNATGRLKENGKKVNTVQTEATSFSGAAFVDIPLPNSPTGVRRWRVTIYGMTQSAANQPRLRLSYAASLKSGASDYAYAVNYYSVGGAAFSRGSDDANDYIALHGENWNATGTIGSDKVSRIMLDIITPNSGTVDTTVAWTACGYTTEATAIPARADGWGHGLGGYGRADSVRVYVASGTIAGTYTVEAVVGTGD